jgi:hypothetical protein
VFIRKLLPVPFQYIDGLPNTGTWPHAKSPWVLLFKENKKLSVISKQLGRTCCSTKGGISVASKILTSILVRDHL